MNRPPKVAPSDLAAPFAGELPDAEAAGRLIGAVIDAAIREARRGYIAAEIWLDAMGIDWRQAGQRRQG